MFIDGKEIFSSVKAKFRRHRIHLSRIFVTNNGKQFKPNFGTEFLEVAINPISKF